MQITTASAAVSRAVQMVTLIAGVLLIDTMPVLADSKECLLQHIAPRIEKMQYQGNDNYAFIMTAPRTNGSLPGRGVRIEEKFSVQTDAGWALLKPADVGHSGPSAILSPSGKNEYDLVLNIPLNTPGIFRTFEGDVSLMQQYIVRCTNESGIESRKTEEVYYWITPRTSRWILREGM